MSDVDHQREVRDELKALRHDVSTLIATVGAHMEQAQQDTSLLKRTVFGDGDGQVGVQIRLDRLERAFSEMHEDHQNARADRRKAVWVFISAIIAAIAGWIVAAIQTFPGHKP